MSKIRMLGAGNGGASKYNVNPWGNQGGGNKKQGLAPTTNKPVQFVLRAIKRRAYSTPEQRQRVFCINQIGGIGAVGAGNRSRTFASRADGVNRLACKSRKVF